MIIVGLALLRKKKVAFEKNSQIFCIKIALITIKLNAVSAYICIKLITSYGLILSGTS